MSSARPECGENCLAFLGEPMLTSDYRNACRHSALRGHIECLRYAHEHGCPWDEWTCSNASFSGHLECLRYAHEHGCPWNGNTCLNASVRGHLDCLRYAHQQGCPWGEYTCYWASRNGHLELLRYAHEHGCPWDEEICSWASENGHLECLRYAHEHGCPWSETTCSWACEKGHLECLQYALDNGCPRPDFLRIILHPVVVPYLYHRGVRFPADSVPLNLHIREHARRGWTLLRCTIALLGAYWSTCDRMYSPGGVGYREAETSFHEAVGRQYDVGTLGSITGACQLSADLSMDESFSD